MKQEKRKINTMNIFYRCLRTLSSTVHESSVDELVCNLKAID